MCSLNPLTTDSKWPRLDSSVVVGGGYIRREKVVVTAAGSESRVRVAFTEGLGW